jgi:ubiquinone/menaquinone biosynthesis C-methylase UbiE
MSSAPSIPGQYTLGDSVAERQRLAQQSLRLETITRRFLFDAGLAPGMRVLELGTGLGDVTCLLAQHVGSAGQVVSLERSNVMLDLARQAIRQHGITNAQFIQCDLNHLQFEQKRPFDAVVGRLILTHLDDPVATVRHVLERLAPGGVVAFQEADTTLSEHLLWLARDRLPLTYQVCQWIDLARKSTAMKPRMGLMLHSVFIEVGLPAPTVHFHTEVYSGNRPDRIRNTVNVLRDLAPRLEPLGISGDAIGLDTLEDRLTAEIVAADVVQALGSIASAWAVKSAT